MEMKILGFGLTIFGVLMLVLVGILATRTHINNKFSLEARRD